MDTTLILMIIAVLIALIAIGVGIVIDRFNNPFQFPVIEEVIDISGRRQPSYEECIDQWIIDHRHQNLSSMVDEMFRSWDTAAKNYIEKTWFWKSHKEDLYLAMSDQIREKTYKAFEFTFTRNQTRYTQKRYQRSAYIVQNVEHVERLTLNDMLAIDDVLEEIEYETTRQKYFAKNQRKLMTKDLRRKIIERDHYTCQICGKYMPDEVGLHVDHIVAIKNGGKTVESNLRVLCDKCNLSKGAKKPTNNS